MLVGPSKSLKQTIQIELKRVRNPNWPEANQLAIYKHGQVLEFGTIGTNPASSVRVGHQLGASKLQVQHSVHSATLPPVAALYAIINYQFKTNELKNLEKLVKQTVQALKPY